MTEVPIEFTIILDEKQVWAESNVRNGLIFFMLDNGFHQANMIDYSIKMDVYFPFSSSELQLNVYNDGNTFESDKVINGLYKIFHYKKITCNKNNRSHKDERYKYSLYFSKRKPDTYIAEPDFQIIVKSVASRIKPLGYKKVKNSFCQNLCDLKKTIVFQKSYMGRKNAIEFTLNIKIEGVSAKNKNELIIVTNRIGSYLHPNNDIWFDIDISADLKRIERIINAYLDEVLKKITPISTIEQATKEITGGWVWRSPVSNT